VTRHFHSLAELGRHLVECAGRSEVAHVAAVRLSADVLHKRATKIYGDATKLEHLAAATQADRAAKGYSPNDPLLRTGELLRDSLEKSVEGSWAGVGSAEPVHLYHEQGYFNVRAGHAVPPRPVFKIALQESAPDIDAIAQDAVAATLGMPSSLLLPILEEG
jgi:phage gpG-like protein